MEILAILYPLNVGTGARPPIRLCSKQDVQLTGFGGQIWWPAITRKPNLAMQLFEGAFTGQTRTGGAALEINTLGLKKADAAALTYNWPGARVEIYAVTAAYVSTLIFDGDVERFEIVDTSMKIEASVRSRKFELPILTASYAGTGGAEGPADLKGRLKPLAMGTPLNVEPVLIDAVNNVYQVHGYGQIQGLAAVYERASSFGTSIGNAASYAALVGLTIPPGRWASCLVEGMFRLGAPATGLITADVQGHNDSGALWRRLPGDILYRIARLAGLADADLHLPSLSGLSAAVPYNMSLYQTDQATVLDMARHIAAQCNAVAGVTWTGQMFTARAAAIGASAAVLEVPAKRRPVALSAKQQQTSAPFWRLEFLARRNWRVHRADEVAFWADLVPRGEYDVGETYREGHIVEQSAKGGVQWLYINPTPTAGNAPPNWPTTSNAFWEVHSPPIGWTGILDDGAKPDDNATRNVWQGDWASLALGFAVIVGDEATKDGSTWIAIAAHSKTALNGPPTLPTTSNATWALKTKVGDAGSPGANGASYLSAYVRAASEPATPADTASWPPSGWYATTTDVPAGGDPIWKVDGAKVPPSVVYVSARPVRHESVTVVTGGDLQKPLGLGTSAILQFKLDAGASRPIEAVWRGTLAATNTLGIDLEWRVEGGSWAAFGSDVPDSGGPGDVAYVTASGSVFNSDSVARIMEVRGTGTRTNGSGGITTDTSASFISG